MIQYAIWAVVKGAVGAVHAGVAHMTAAHAANVATAHGTAAANGHAAVHAAGDPVAAHMAHQAGKEAASSLASGGTHALEAVSARSIFTGHAVLTATAHGAMAAGVGYGGSWAVDKLMKSFAKGFAYQLVKTEWRAHVDVSDINDWFAQNAQTVKQALMFTATGRATPQSFYAAPPSSGPSNVLQGYFDPTNNRMVSGRIMRQVQSMDHVVLHNHRGTGIAVYT